MTLSPGEYIDKLERQITLLKNARERIQDLLKEAYRIYDPGCTYEEWLERLRKDA